MKTVNPLFSNKCGIKEDILLVTGDNIISEVNEVTKTFNDFFKNCLNSLNITENMFLITDTDGSLGGAEKPIKKLKTILTSEA